ncbi:lipopolysaccharide biosynthesis protein [Flavobacterium filum]|uniref:lipopolysaccharide biosynthesis protein n=1 Tax=Flavobacterium filum TaxID=370974 RepID=UPI0004276543|nr:lipopolysaccharide biosynthesis protein [Flavobacterium filum]
MTIAKKAGTAAKLMIIRRVWGALVSFSVMAYLARTLNKEDFGIVAISAVLLSFIQILAISGISEYVIFYNKEDRNKIINSAFWLNIFLSFIVSVVILALSPIWASFYKDDRIIYIVVLLVFSFFFNMIASIPNGIYRKELNYKPMLFIQALFGTFNNIGQVLLAYFGFGIYSLVLPNAILSPFLALMLLYKSGFRPNKDFGRKYWSQIFDYTKYVIGQRVMGKLVNEGDTFIVGKFFGMASLGVYNLAYQFSNLFNGYFQPIVNNITLPLFSKNNNNIQIVRNHYIKMIDLISIITIPVMTLMLINAKLLIQFIYGEKWLDSVIIFQVLAFFVMIKSITSPTNGLFNAMGQPRKSLLFLRIFVPIFLISIFIGAQFKSLFIFTLILVIVRMIGSLILMKDALKLINITNFNAFKDVLFLVVLSVIFSALSFIIPDYLFLKLIMSFLFLLSVFLYFKILSNAKYQSILMDIKKLI